MSAVAPSRKFLTFFVGGEQFAVQASDVLEIHRPPRLTRIPNGPPSLLGIGSLRGMPAPVISLARLLGRPGGGEGGPDARLLLVDGVQAVGLAVDKVGSLQSIATGTSEVEGRREGFGRLYRIDEKGVRTLDLDALLKSEFAHLGHARQTAAPAPAAPQVRAETRRAERAFLSFDLAGQAYALPVGEVEEMLALPGSMANLAQSADAVLGVVALRDRLLPVVSLRRLLGLPAEHKPSDRVVVARIGTARIGLAVDRLRSILRVAEETIDAAPAVLNRGAGEAQVQSICRLQDNRGLVAILSAERLFRDETVAHILADGQDESGDMTQILAEGALERFLIFRLGAEEYGLPLAAVDEVVRLPEQMTRLPNAPDFIEGIVTLRGKVIPVIDQRMRFASAAGELERRPRIVVTTVEGRKAGFIVDSAAEILALGADSITTTSELAAEAGRLFSRVASLDGGKRLILLIDPKELLDRAEHDSLARLESTMETSRA